MSEIFTPETIIEAQEVLKFIPFFNREKAGLQSRVIINELVYEINNHRILKPQAIFETYRITEIDNDKIYLEGGEVLRGTLPSHLLKLAEEVITLVCTIGKDLEREVEHYYRKKKMVKAVLMDDIGNFALNLLAINICQIVGLNAEKKGYYTSKPLTPGLRGFPLEEQGNIYKLAKAQNTNISLTSHLMLDPRKSLSMVIGSSANPFNQTDNPLCTYCEGQGKCRYNKSSGPSER